MNLPPLPPVLHLLELLQVLARHDVEHVVIGGIAVALHGAERATKDLDVVPRSTPENLARLWRALSSIQARPQEPDGFRPEELPLPWSLASLIEGQGNWILHTDLGRIDVMQWAAPFDGYDDLVDNAATVELEEVGQAVRYAGLDDLIAMKQAAGRPQDLIDITALRIANGLEAYGAAMTPATGPAPAGPPAPPPGPAPADVAAVIARMEEILGGCARGDGVGAFTELYLAVTRGVQAELARLAFADPAFLARLDAVFAGLFFDAVRAYGPGGDPRRGPRAWAPLFEARGRKGVAPLQFALAGMNAHINRDLPVAVVRTCQELGVTPADGCPQHGDYLRVNGLLAAVERQVKARYLTGVLAVVDRLLHRVRRIDDVAAMWSIEQARNAAWVNAQALWELRGDERLAAAFTETLDRSVGLAGRGLLVPAETRVARAGRWLSRLL